MNSSLKPAFEKLDKALDRLETAVEKNIASARQQPAPQPDLNAKNEREINRKIAAKLDQTINRLEMLLNEE